MLTDKELAKLNVWAIKAYPFPDDYGETEKFSEEKYNELSENNKRFFLAAKNFIPELITELLSYRNEPCCSESCCELEEIESQPTEITIYEGEVNIVNNYTTNMDTIHEIITERLGEHGLYS